MLLFQDIDLVPYFRLAVVSLPFSLISGVALLTLRLTFKSKSFSLIIASSVLVQAVASIYLVVLIRMDIMGVFLAHLITVMFRAIVGISLTYKHFGLVISKSWLKTMLAFGLPLVPASLSLWILNYSNRYFLIRFATMKDVGLLSAGSRVASIVIFIITAFRTAWGPFAYSLIEDEGLARKTYSKALTYFLLVALIATVSVSVFAREGILVLAPATYQESAVVVPFLAYSAISWGCVYIVSIGYGIAKKSVHTTIATILGAVINTGCNFLLIPKWGIIGASFSTMLGNLIALTYSYSIAKRYFTVDYEFRKVAILLSTATTAIAGALLVDRNFAQWSTELLLYKVPLFLLFLISPFVFRIIGREELKWARGYIAGKFLRSFHSTEF